MKLRLDSTKCSGYGQCADTCPAMFELDEWGYAVLKREGEVPPEAREQARRAISACPEQAIGSEERATEA